MSAGRKHRPVPTEPLQLRLAAAIEIAKARAYAEDERVINWTALVRQPDGSQVRVDAAFTVRDLHRLLKLAEGRA